MSFGILTRSSRNSYAAIDALHARLLVNDGRVRIDGVLPPTKRQTNPTIEAPTATAAPGARYSAPHTTAIERALSALQKGDTTTAVAPLLSASRVIVPFSAQAVAIEGETIPIIAAVR